MEGRKAHQVMERVAQANTCRPSSADLPVAAIDTALVLKVLKPIWGMKTKTAVDVRLRIELILNWAKIHGYRDGENPARWKGHLENALPKPSKIAKISHHPAMPYDELPGFMGKLRNEKGIAAAALNGRSWRPRGPMTRWDSHGPRSTRRKTLWTIPAERMKADADHRVPLSDRMLEILGINWTARLTFVFSGEDPKKKLPHEAMLKALKAIRPGFTVTASDRASRTGHRADSLFERGFRNGARAQDLQRR